MRWTSGSKPKPKPKPKPKHGDTRIIKCFLLFPTKVLGSKEWRWLERVHIKQEWFEYNGLFGRGWSNVEWVDNVEERIE